MSACASCGFELPEHNRLCPLRFGQPQPTADHGISPAQLRDKVEALEAKLLSHAALLGQFTGELNVRLDAALKRIEQLDHVNASLLDRVNQLVEFHGIPPIGGARIRIPDPETIARCTPRPSAPIDQEDV